MIFSQLLLNWYTWSCRLLCSSGAVSTVVSALVPSTPPLPLPLLSLNQSGAVFSGALIAPKLHSFPHWSGEFFPLTLVYTLSLGQRGSACATELTKRSLEAVLSMSACSCLSFSLSGSNLSPGGWAARREVQTLYCPPNVPSFWHTQSLSLISPKSSSKMESW